MNRINRLDLSKLPVRRPDDMRSTQYPIELARTYDMTQIEERVLQVLDRLLALRHD